jgi:hypothetical protein
MHVTVRPSVRAAGPVLLALLLVPTAWAQDGQPPQGAADSTQTGVLYACFVPPTGLVYRIKEKGLPKECLAPEHIAFRWSTEAAVESAGGQSQAANDVPPIIGVVKSLNELQGDLLLAAEGGISLSSVGNTITIGSEVFTHEADQLVVKAPQGIAAPIYTSTSPLRFEAPPGQERMRISDETGHVGVGLSATEEPAGRFHVKNEKPEAPGALMENIAPSNEKPAIHGKNAGEGPAAKFEHMKAGSNANAMEAKNNGQGAAVHGKNDGEGPAARFENAHGGNANAMEAQSNGQGASVHGKNDGDGPAARFENAHGGNANAMEAQSNGQGASVHGKNEGE